MHSTVFMPIKLHDPPERSPWCVGEDHSGAKFIHLTPCTTHSAGAGGRSPYQATMDQRQAPVGVRWRCPDRQSACALPSAGRVVKSESRASEKRSDESRSCGESRSLQVEVKRVLKSNKREGHERDDGWRSSSSRPRRSEQSCPWRRKPRPTRLWRKLERRSSRTVQALLAGQVHPREE